MTTDLKEAKVTPRTKLLIETFLNFSIFFPYRNITSSTNALKTFEDRRIFSHTIKEKCWNSSPTVEGRDPHRWRRDILGNPVLKNLRGCGGIFCHEYDHIFPYSLGGTSTLDNCQILQTSINRKKGNNYYSNKELLRFKAKYPDTLRKYGLGQDAAMDIAEELLYGNVNKI